jgi:hypothetical protein
MAKPGNNVKLIILCTITFIDKISVDDAIDPLQGRTRNQSNVKLIFSV